MSFWIVGFFLFLVLLTVAGADIARTRRALRRRDRLYLVPADDFDANLEEVRRFGLQLGRARRRLVTPGERMSGSIRLRMDSAGEGAVVFGAEVPGYARAVLTSAMYSGVQLIDGDRFADLPALAQRPDDLADEA